jgi:hypothetical protein
MVYNSQVRRSVGTVERAFTVPEGKIFQPGASTSRNTPTSSLEIQILKFFAR